MDIATVMSSSPAAPRARTAVVGALIEAARCAISPM